MICKKLVRIASPTASPFSRQTPETRCFPRHIRLCYYYPMRKWLQLNETVRVEAQASGLPDSFAVTITPGESDRWVFGGGQYAVCGGREPRPEPEPIRLYVPEEQSDASDSVPF